MDTNLIAAVRCGICGKIKFHNLSMFKLSAGTKVKLYCDCGSMEMDVSLKDNKVIMVDISCIACDINHTYTYNLKEVLKRKVTIICCMESGLELCFLGRDRDVRDIVLRYQEDINHLLGELGLLDDIEEDLIKKIIKKIP